MSEDPDNPMLNVETIHIDKKPVQTLTAEDYLEFRAMLGERMTMSAKHGRARPTTSLDVTDFLIGTGLRPGEPFAIRLEDVNSEDWTIHIHATVIALRGQGAQIQEHTKTGDNTILRIPEFLRSLVARRLQEPVVQKSGLLFPSERGTVMDPSSHAKIFRKAVKGSKWEWVTPRTARSAVATHLANNASLEAAQGQLRHRKGSNITLKHYVQQQAEIVDFAHLLEAFSAHSPTSYLESK